MSVAMPLFNKDELRSAFRLILDSAVASEVADEWFATFAGPEDIDGSGMYIHRGFPDLGFRAVAGGLVVSSGAASEEAQALGMRRLLKAIRDHPSEQLMTITKLHLDLVSLVSPEAAERVRAVWGASALEAMRRRDEFSQAAGLSSSAIVPGWAQRLVLTSIPGRRDMAGAKARRL